MVDFYPRSPCGERRKRGSQDRHGYSFLSTLSLRRATLLMWYQCNTVVFLSTLSLRRATRRVLKCDNRAIISIHALLAESDAFRSPRIALMVGFLSTLSLRRATWRSNGMTRTRLEISIHALLAESDHTPHNGGPWQGISIHALLAESDARIIDPTYGQEVISIHALLAESDIIPIGVGVTAPISIHALLAESDRLL